MALIGIAILSVVGVVAYLQQPVFGELAIGEAEIHSDSAQLEQPTRRTNLCASETPNSTQVEAAEAASRAAHLLAMANRQHL